VARFLLIGSATGWLPFTEPAIFSTKSALQLACATSVRIEIYGKMKNASIYFVVGIVVATLSNNPATGQIGKDTSIWQWTVSSDHHNSIVQVIVDEGMGTGVIVLVDKQKPVADGFEGYCLTAYHVVSSDQQRRAIRVKYRNGRGANRCKVVYFDKENDLALL